jgi:pimeloyl-ACP methyl ester carboxylesterase
MQAYFFGEAERHLLACFHPASHESTARRLPAVLVCGPHGQEAVRAHRMLRVLAERLSRLGFDVLRFDPYGTGDSAGDDEELELLGWQRDLVQASQELSRRSAGRSQIWLGFRLGATVACRAAVAATSGRPASLLLVEPVFEGQAYLDGLAFATVQLLEASMSIKNPAWRLGLRQAPQLWQQEAVGFGLGPELHAQLRTMKRSDWVLPSGVRLDMVVPTQEARNQILAWLESQRHPGLAVIAQPYDFDWTAEDALNSALVPHGLLAQLLSLCQTPIDRHL